MEDMDLNAGRDFFNTNCVLGGFYNRKNGVLYSGTLDEIKSEKRYNIGADCTLSNDIDLLHIKCVADTARSI